MKKLLIAILLLASVSAGAQGVKFRHGGFDEALKEAAQRDMMVFVDYMATWCGPCKKAQQEVFDNDSLAVFFNTHFICVKIDSDTPEGKQFNDRYSIQSLPSFLFIRPNGEVAVREGGYGKAQRLMDQAYLGFQLKDAESEQEKMNKAYQSHRYDGDTTFLQQYMRLMERNGVNTCDVLEQYIALLEKQGMPASDIFHRMYEFRKGLRLRGNAERIFMLGEDTWIAANPAFRKSLEYLYVVSDLSKYTYEHATKTKNYDDLVYSLDFMAEYSGKEVNKTTLILDYFNAIGDGANYKKLAKPYLDSLYKATDFEAVKKRDQAGLEALAKRMEERKAVGNIDDHGIRMSYLATHNLSLGNKTAYLFSTYAYHYLRFTKDKKEMAAMLPYLKVATELASFSPFYVSNYADALYLYGDRKQGLGLKKKALGMEASLEQNAGFMSNLNRMEQNKPLEGF